MDDIKILFELYKEQRELGIHHEDQRSKVSGLILTAASILIGLTSFDDKLTYNDLPVAILIISVGIFGVFFTLKNYERFNFHRKRSRIIRDAIDAALRTIELENENVHKIRQEIRQELKLNGEKPSLLIKDIVKMANQHYKENNILLERMRLNWFWTTLHIIVMLIGIVLIILIVCH